jgi:hypothetical protein
MGNHKEVFGYATSGIANAITVTVAANGIDVMLQTLLLIIGIISGILSIMYSAYKWYHRATHPDSHGGTKITSKEIEEGIKDLMEVTRSVNKNK